jgi:CubicO group peptidase (beta-lactamase class C family)
MGMTAPAAGRSTSRSSAQRLPQAKPEERGLDRERLNAMLGVVREWGIRSVFVAKDAHSVWEWHEAESDRPAAIYSCTKSVLATVIGIAMDEGHIASLDQSLGEYLPLAQLHGGDKLANVKLKHLLAMTPGFDWPDFDKPYKQLKQADDGIRYVLERPIVHEPGEAFTYNSGGSHLLAAVLAAAVKQDPLAYAKAVLFEPLGIRRLKWNEHQGLIEGGTGLHLSTHDLAKLGILYANNGRWGDRQIVSSEWVNMATRPHSKGLVNYKPSIYGQYGYHWWVSSGQSTNVPNYYFAFGYGGQYLAVAPDHQLVAVVRKSLSGRNDAIWSRQLLHDYIFASLPAIE